MAIGQTGKVCFTIQLCASLRRPTASRNLIQRLACIIPCHNDGFFELSEVGVYFGFSGALLDAVVGNDRDCGENTDDDNDDEEFYDGESWGSM